MQLIRNGHRLRRIGKGIAYKLTQGLSRSGLRDQRNKPVDHDFVTEIAHTMAVGPMIIEAEDVSSYTVTSVSTPTDEEVQTDLDCYVYTISHFCSNRSISPSRLSLIMEQCVHEVMVGIYLDSSLQGEAYKALMCAAIRDIEVHHVHLATKLRRWSGIVRLILFLEERLRKGPLTGAEELEVTHFLDNGPEITGFGVEMFYNSVVMGKKGKPAQLAIEWKETKKLYTVAEISKIYSGASFDSDTLAESCRNHISHGKKGVYHLWITLLLLAVDAIGLKR